jgi:hypothetical protein
MSGIARRMVALIGALAMAGEFLVGLEGQATPAPASPTVIGQTGNDGTVCTFGASMVQVATGTGVPSYVVPAGLNEITAWSIQEGPGGNGDFMALEVWRPTTTPNSFSLVGISPIEALTANKLNQFTLSTPILAQPGDLLGLYVRGGNCEFSFGGSGDAVDIQSMDNPPAPGSAVAFKENVGRPGELNVAATLAFAPSITKSFAPSFITQGGTTSVTFTLTNPNSAVPLTGLGFTDALPAGLVVAQPNKASTTCHDPELRPAADPGSSTITVRQGSLRPAETCTATVSIQGNNPGDFTNTTSAVTSDQGTGNTASAKLTVVGPPLVSQSFGGPSIPLGTSTSLSFTVTNPNPTTVLSGVSFSDTLPSGLVVDTPNNGLTGSCLGGTIAAGSGSTGISLAGATIPASGSCTFSVEVVGLKSGKQVNVTGPPSSNEGGQGKTTTASVIVNGCPAGQVAHILQATTNVGTILGAFCVDPVTGSGTYTQGTVSGTAQFTRGHGTTTISASGTNLALNGVIDKSTNHFVETLPINATGTFDLDKTLTLHGGPNPRPHP